MASLKGRGEAWTSAIRAVLVKQRLPLVPAPEETLLECASGRLLQHPRVMPTRDCRWLSLCFNLSIPGALYTQDCWFHVPRRG